MVNDNQDKLTAELDKLTGKPFTDAMFSLMEYVQPKLNRTELKVAEVVKPRKVGFLDENIEEAIEVDE